MKTFHFISTRIALFAIILSLFSFFPSGYTVTHAEDEPRTPTNLFVNPSFEAAINGNWHLWIDQGTSIAASADVALTGTNSLKASGIGLGGPYQYVDIEPGEYRFKLSYYSDAPSSTAGTVTLAANYYDLNYIGSISGDSHHAVDTAGSWHTVEWFFDVPETYNSRTIERLQLVISLNGFTAGEMVYLDDAELVQVPVVSITDIHAANGSVVATLEDTPLQVPVAADFQFIQEVSGNGQVPIVPIAYAWDSITNRATIGVPPVQATGIDQPVNYSVTYKGSTGTAAIIVPADRTKSLLANSSFESALAGNWNIWLDAPISGTAMERSMDYANNGSYALKATGVGLGAPYQYVPAEAGNYTLSMTYYVPPGTLTAGIIQPGINFYDYAYMGTISDQPYEAGDSTGQWHTVSWSFEIPETLYRRTVQRLQVAIQLEGFEAGTTVYLDDIEIHYAPPKPDVSMPMEAGHAMPKLILHEQPFVDHAATPAEIAANIAHIDALPFDGITISPDIRLGLMSITPISYADIYDELEVLDGLFTNLTDNYLQLQINKPYDPLNPASSTGDLFDDLSWGIVAQNFKNYARAAKDVGITNFFFDNEEYWEPFLNFPGTSYYTGKTVEEYQDKARQRGKELMAAILSEIPAAKLVQLHGPYLSDARLPGWFGKGNLPFINLYGGFFVGMVEAVKEGGNLATIIDGGESYLERTRGEFTDNYQYRKYEFPSYPENSYIPASIREDYPSIVKMSAGLYTHDWIPGYPMNPTVMRSTLENALRSNEEMIWFYHEPNGTVYGNWLIPGSVSTAWFDAVTGAREAVLAKPTGLNRIYNSGFEFVKANWQLDGSATVATAINGVQAAYSHAKGLVFGSNGGEARQRVANLKPGNAYELAAWLKVLNSSDAVEVGIVFTDELEQIIATYSFEGNALAYSMGSMAFVAPTAFEEAHVYVKRAAGSDVVFADDMLLYEWYGAPTAILAANGSIELAMDLVSDNYLSITDFVVKMRIDGGSQTTVVPSAMAWDALSQTVTLTIPLIGQAALAQEVVHEVTYKGALQLTSEEFVVPGL